MFNTSSMYSELRILFCNFKSIFNLTGIDMNKIPFIFCLTLMIGSMVFAQEKFETTAPEVKTENGVVEGINDSGILIFKGIPFAEPPVGKLRWKEPQPVKNWSGVLKATKFAPQAMQPAIFSDMVFRSNGKSEDCLYLNVWTPAKTNKDLLPVLVYYYGGGFIAGDGSEFRYDGESIARKGIVVVTVNYRLGIFGFFAYPGLTKESPHHSSGNYGLLDQSAALHWVSNNIRFFGGDPSKITIAGESAGSMSVSAQMASPLSNTLIAGAIGESGSFLGTRPMQTLSEAEKKGIDFAKSINVNSLAGLRAVPAEKLLEAVSKMRGIHFSAIVDGYFFPKNPHEIYNNGEQAHVPLLVGWNSEESNFHGVLGQEKPTLENFTKAVQKLYSEDAEKILKVYHASSDEEVEQVASDLAGDRFIAFSTWKWFDMQCKTGREPVYRYWYSRPRPALRSEINAANIDPKVSPAGAKGAVHSAEIEYAMGNLPTNRVYNWQPEDYKVSEIMQSFFANFIKIGNPNGIGVPEWPSDGNSKPVDIMNIDVNTKVIPESDILHQRYLLLDQLSSAANR